MSNRFDPSPAMELAWQMAPLGDRYGQRTIQSACEYIGVSTRQWNRWASGESQMTLKTADEVAVRLGRHPAELWDNWIPAEVAA